MNLPTIWEKANELIIIISALLIICWVAFSLIYEKPSVSVIDTHTNDSTITLYVFYHTWEGSRVDSTCKFIEKLLVDSTCKIDSISEAK